MGQAKERRDAESASCFTIKRRTSSVWQHKEATFMSLCRLYLLGKKKENSVHELLPPAHAEVKCKMHGRMRVAGRGEAMQMLMQALECSYRLMQPLSPVVPAHLLKAKNTF